MDLITAPCRRRAQHTGRRPSCTATVTFCGDKLAQSAAKSQSWPWPSVGALTHPVGEFGAAVVPLRQVKNRVVVGVPAVEERADVLHVVLVADLHRLGRVRHHCRGRRRVGLRPTGRSSSENTAKLLLGIIPFNAHFPTLLPLHCSAFTSVCNSGPAYQRDYQHVRTRHCGIERPSGDKCPAGCAL